MLGKMHKKEYAYIVGNATVGIYLTLKVLNISKKRIAIPNSICPNVPLAILFSGNIPVFFDISNKNLGLQTDSLLDNKEAIDVVLANHSYGSICDIEEIQSFCNIHNKLLIEDFAVAQGGGFNNKPVGSFGDVSVVSFGAGKIVSVGHGGAIFSNDKSFIKEIEALERTFDDHDAKKEEGIAYLAKYFKDLYNNHYGTEYWQNDIDFYNKAKSYRNSFFHKFSKKYEDILLEKLEDLQENIKRRNEKATILTKLFKQAKNDNIKIFVPPDGSVYWRYNIFIKENRNHLLKYLLHKKYRISSWYPSVNVLFNNANVKKTATPNSDGLSDEIINIWVSDEIDVNYINNVVKDIVYFCAN